MNSEIYSVTGVSIETVIAHSTSRRCAPSLRRFPLHGKRLRGSASMSEADGHDVAVARSIERMRGSTRVIDGRPSPRNGARNSHHAGPFLSHSCVNDHDPHTRPESGRQSCPEPSRCTDPRLESNAAITVLCRAVEQAIPAWWIDLNQCKNCAGVGTQCLGAIPSSILNRYACSS